MTELLTWITDGTLPDEETTVLAKALGTVEMAFVESGEWYWSSGGHIQVLVIGWTNIPKGPEAPKRGNRRGEEVMNTLNEEQVERIIAITRHYFAVGIGLGFILGICVCGVAPLVLDRLAARKRAKEEWRARKL